ncbi:MAG TPA: hypothetical protein DIC19_05090 [Erysipelotrichaceae bacterium]|nr:hypothetical protein [Erysipelotrichaceae bacterium]
MITIFNRKELFITLDMAKLTRVKEILSSNQIDYRIKTTNLQSASFVGSSRSRTGSFGVNQTYSYEYRVFTHKADHARASHLIR